MWAFLPGHVVNMATFSKVLKGTVSTSRLQPLLRRWLVSRAAVRDALEYQVFGREVSVCVSWS